MVAVRWLQKLAVVIAIAAVCGCSTRTYVSATGSTPPQFTHVFLTVKEMWFNSAANAQPGDSGWSKFTLSEPVTIDLVNSSNGTLTRLIGALRLAPGTYSQVRLIPVDNLSTTLAASAAVLGAAYNNEVDYVDTTSVSHQLPLEMLNPETGIGVQGSLNVPVGGGAAVASSPTGTSSTRGAVTTGLGANSSPTILNFAINFNAATDIALFTYGTQSAAVLNSHAHAFDLAKSGGISGTLTLTNLVNITNASARFNISATAESLSEDGSRHVAVLSAPIQSDGTFLLYPLPANDSTKNPTTYDVVIHGAGIETIIIKGVQVGRSSASSSSSSSAKSLGTASVSIGTLIPKTAASYTVNLASVATLPAGAFVSLHQTLTGTGEVPYVIEHGVIDPFKTTMQTGLPVSSANVQVGTYTSDSQTLTLTTATPVEGVGSYTVAASAMLFADGALNTVAGPPGSGNETVTSPSSLSVAAGASNVAIMALVTQSSGGAYNRGQLIISRDGTIIATSAIDAALVTPGGGSVTVSGLPGGSASAVYPSGIFDVTARVWNAQDPAGTLQLRYFPAAVDVRNGSVGGISIAIN